MLKFKKPIEKCLRWQPPTGRKDFVKLDLNENYSVFDEKFIRKLKNFDSFTVSSYPEYDELLLQLGRYTGLPKNHIALTNGADHAIELVLELFFNKKSRVVMPSPVFMIYDKILQLLEVKTIHIPYKNKNNIFDFPFDEVLKQIKKSDGLLLCNPSNPLGSPINEKQLLRLIQETFILKIPCVIDEAYYEFYGKTAARLVKKYPNVIVVRTFSKMFGLAGLRIGYVVAAPSVTDRIIAIRGPWALNHFAVFAAVCALKNKKFFDSKLREILAVKNNLEIFLKNKGVQVYKTNANFIIARFKNHKTVQNFLKNKKILVNDVSHYPFSFGLLENTLRITVPGKKHEAEYCRHMKTILEIEVYQKVDKKDAHEKK